MDRLLAMPIVQIPLAEVLIALPCCRRCSAPKEAVVQMSRKAATDYLAGVTGIAVDYVLKQ